MSTDFQILPMAHEHFADLFQKTDAELAKLSARRMTVDANPGFPCRVSLQDAEIGDEVILAPVLFHDTPSPYQASGPVFARKGVTSVTPAKNEIPAMLTARPQSLRAYDANGMMIAAAVSDGNRLRKEIETMMEDPHTEYVHLHNAKPGCYNCKVVRA